MLTPRADRRAIALAVLFSLFGIAGYVDSRPLVGSEGGIAIETTRFMYETKDLSVDVERPVFPTGRRYEPMRRGTAGEIDSFVDEMTDAARNDHETAEHDRMELRQYTCFVRYTVTRNDGRYVSLFVDLYRYTGGAHGGTDRRGFVYDASTGKRLGLDSFFGSLAAARDAVVPVVQAAAEADPRIYFDNTADDIRNTISNYDAYLNDHAIVYFFQQYEIAPYATGIPEFEVRIDAIN
jgi:hypothetical protein